ncbi:hypothetical protein Ddye_017277 [Dipteronia dyeriana]|uniref:ABC transporter domain-containing protein n=1 Tax=Dipteronia dyeriana TaxID=168575 RepID=A0AAD9X0T4_9ROSI|nr:hypothetical protein Ddye_017277 [Dipteronia dyeriana]
MVDVTKLGDLERRAFIEKLITKIEDDNRWLLQKLKERIEKVGLELPTVEVRFQNLSVEAECRVVHGDPLPTLWNTIKNILFVVINTIGKSEGNKIQILKDVSGIIKPSRLTLLLGPPGCGKTTLLQALAGKLNQSLKVTGEITYNGYKFNEFAPQKTSAYISQQDLHISEMTVRETLDFSARCQGTGSRADIMKEVNRREKQAGIIPEADIDTFMKAISVEGLKRTLQTDYILKILGLDTCADTIVGDAMNRGISGGEKKRLTTGWEMIVGPTRALFMDEISNGLDSSTTFQIVTCLQQLTHITDSTILVSLLQPAPETFDLFDDIILMAEGMIAYHGPRSYVLEFFEHCGFKCPPRKGVADFLQEVVSKKDQAQYWYHKHLPYSYVSVDKFVYKFQEFHVGQKLGDELSMTFNKSESHKNSLSFSIYSLRKCELLKACLAREWLLMKRNSFVHVFKSAQLVVIALITVTMFIRTQMKIDVIHANFYMGSLFYALVRLLTNGFAELPMIVSRLPIFYKQSDFYFYPAWACSLPSIILKVPFSMLDAFLWTAITYYAIGYSPEPERFFRQFLLLFFLHQVSTSLFRLIASLVRDPPLAASCGLLSILVMFLFGGFLIPYTSLPAWLQWGFWISPLAYVEIGVSVNEFLSPRWQQILSSNTTLGHQVLKNRGLNFSDNFYWVSIGALLGFWLIFNVGFTLALAYLRSPGSSRTDISYEQLSYFKRRDNLSNVTVGRELCSIDILESSVETKTTGMLLPFESITLTFENVQYFVDTPKKLRDQGFPEKRLQLLQDITGAFRPGILTALMGVSGAGKTTLMDVLSGRKTGGTIEGEIRVGGYPKVQETYARVSGYCEQTDIHSPQITIEESVTFSAWLRLPAHIDRHSKSAFVQEVLQLIELDEISNALVGVPGISGISNEQRKRLTIAVELVSNPSIIFMDEPTSGLDARAAAIVMRVVKNIVHTKRTVVCTIHQPSIDIFEAFDELILMKRGGLMIYSGELGQHSSKLIEYFEGIPGVTKVKENYNPATWMLEVTSPSAEAQLGLDFAHHYKKSSLCQKIKELVKELSLPAQGSKELHFSTHFEQNGWEQFKACLWKQQLTYWRSPKYNLVRLTNITISSLLLGALLWHKGQKIDYEQDFLNVLGAMYIFQQTIGISNCATVIPFIAKERYIVYRERFAGMYSSWAYSFAQVMIEIPYSFVQAALFSAITYTAINFYWSAYKIFMYFYTMFCTVLFFNYFGMLLASLTPTYQVASVCSNFGYTMFNLFAGFLIPGPKIPKWWIWVYWICPTAWSLKGLLTSQYGDIKEETIVYGERQAINVFLESHYGYRYTDLPVVAIVLLAFPLFFAFAFACATSKLNFQKR